MNITITDIAFIDGLIARVDQAADAVRRQVVGDPVRVKEYEMAHLAAETFRDAGYTGEVSPYVRCWAEAKGWTDRQAADDILAASARWYAALEAIRDLRLKAKEAIRAAATAAQAQATFETYLATLTTLMEGVA